MDFFKKLINKMNKYQKVFAIITFIIFLLSIIFLHPVITYASANLLVDSLFGPTYGKQDWYKKLILANSIVCLILFVIAFVVIL